MGHTMIFLGALMIICGVIGASMSVDAPVLIVPFVFLAAAGGYVTVAGLS